MTRTRWPASASAAATLPAAEGLPVSALVIPIVTRMLPVSSCRIQNGPRDCRLPARCTEPNPQARAKGSSMLISIQFSPAVGNLERQQYSRAKKFAVAAGRLLPAA